MTWIVRHFMYHLAKRQADVIYTTIEPEDLVVKFPEQMREKANRGPFIEVEGTGKLMRNRLDLYLGHGGRTERGQKRSSGNAHVAFKGLEHKQHVRELTTDDLWAIERHDDDIAALEKRVLELRDERRELVRKAWRRAQPIGLDALEERARERERERAKDGLSPDA
jgi:hypothetical protein